MFYPVISILSIIGFFVSRHIYRAKKTGVKLVCHFGGGKQSCNEVVESEYGKTFGVPNEVAGMVYCVAVLLLSLYLLNSPLDYTTFNVFLIISGIAFIFSIYLIFIQAFVLKKFCEWCLATALINIFIFTILTAFYYLFYSFDAVLDANLPIIKL